MVGLARSGNVAHASPNATKVHVISGMVKPWGLSKPVGLMWFICRCQRAATLPVTGGSTAAWRMLDMPDIPGEAVHSFWIRPCISAFLIKLSGGCIKILHFDTPSAQSLGKFCVVAIGIPHSHPTIAA